MEAFLVATGNTIFARSFFGLVFQYITNCTMMMVLKPRLMKNCKRYMKSSDAAVTIKVAVLATVPANAKKKVAKAFAPIDLVWKAVTIIGTRVIIIKNSCDDTT